MPDFSLEVGLNESGLIFGTDEVGRGPLCGPVMAAAVAWPDLCMPEHLQHQINDSKKLSSKKRQELYQEILNSNAIIGVGSASVEEIDSINILQASFLAMRRALQQVESNGFKIAAVLVDGNRSPKDWLWTHKTVVKGDSLSLSIASASIVAKVLRDNLMADWANAYPEYGWDKNAGYGTAEHLSAIQKYGITPLHRKSFAPINKMISTFL